MFFAKNVAVYALVRFLTVLVALMSYIAVAVHLPNHLRYLQRLIMWGLDGIERLFDIPATYMVWADIAEVHATILFVAFYCLSFFSLMLFWYALKRGLKLLGNGLYRLSFGAKRRKRPAT